MEDFLFIIKEAFCGWLKCSGKLNHHATVGTGDQSEKYVNRRKKHAAYFQAASALGGSTSSLTQISRRKPPKHRQRTPRPKTARSTPCAEGVTLVSSVKDTRAATSSMCEPRLAPARSRRLCPLFALLRKKSEIRNQAGSHTEKRSKGDYPLKPSWACENLYKPPLFR